MTIYEHKTQVTAASGSTSSDTLKVRGGILRYLLIRANTSSTLFRASLVDENSVTRINYGFSTGELVDDKIAIPVVGTYTINITNASPDDTFQVVFSVEE